MENPAHFDAWSATYDHDTAQSDADSRYPFAGYRAVMDDIFAVVAARAPARVLDLGVGTGVLGARLSALGCEITGVDFSPDMLAGARAAMPEATLICHDLTLGLPDLAGPFDVILSTYFFHHIADAHKPAFLRALRPHLAPGGRVLLGDIAFGDGAALEACRAQSGDAWDAAEHYLVFDRLRDALAGDFAAEFRAKSFCAAVVELQPR
jgi:putative AdoMet-dependent methyltransferase